MDKYFVVFYAEYCDNVPQRGVIEYDKTIKAEQDIENIENIICKEWFADEREIILLNFKKL